MDIFGLQIFGYLRRASYWPTFFGTAELNSGPCEADVFVKNGLDTMGIVTVTTKIVTFLIGNPYKPSFTTVTVRGPHPSHHHEKISI